MVKSEINEGRGLPPAWKGEKMPDLMRKIPVKDIKTDGQMVRDQQDDDHIAELVNSISRNGLLQPIVVQPIPDGTYQLAAGFHRLMACTRMGWTEIPAVIRDGDTTPTKGIALVENIMRRDMTLDEECSAVTHLTDTEKLSPSQICDLVGKSRAWVDRRLAIPGLPKNVRSAVLEGLISIQVAEIIGGIAHDGTRGTLLNQAIYSKLTAGQVSDLREIYELNPYITEPISPPSKSAAPVEAAQESGRQCGICGESKTYADLQPVWICRAGCRPTTTKGKEDKEPK